MTSADGTWHPSGTHPGPITAPKLGLLHPTGSERPFVLVTGAAGFIGSHLSEALLARGERVVGLDNFNPTYDTAIKRHNLAQFGHHPDFTFVEGDIRSTDHLHRAFSLGDVRAVVHLAACAGVRPSLVDPGLYNDVNVNGTLCLMDAMREAGCRQLVFGSSSSVYGATSVAPFSESEAADHPSSPYAASKRAGELFTYTYHHLYDMAVTCLRFFTVYGPRQRPDMAIHKFTRQIDSGQTIQVFGDGKSVRDYTFVADIVGGILGALDHPDGYRIYNLGATGLTPLMDLVSMIAARLGRPLRLEYLPDQPGDVPLTHADVTAATADLDYRVTTPIEDGLDRWVEWYLARKAALGAA